MAETHMQQKVHAVGPLVWRDMDQKTLDDAYDQLIFAPNRDLVLGRNVAAAARSRAALGEPQRVAYGPSEHEMLDIFRAAPSSSSAAGGGGKGAGAPINIFVHGGAWRRGSAADYAHVADPLVGAGAHAVIIDFTTVDQAGGDLFPMSRQVSRAIAWVSRNAETFGGDRNRLYVSAHSSGAHLAACALSLGWREQGLAPGFCKGAMLISGMYDLEPVRLSKRSEYVKFTDAMEQDLSAQRHIDGFTMPVIVAHGTSESPEFQRQARDFFAALKAAERPAELIVGENYNHFEIFETLTNPYGLLGRALLQQMGLT
jgi:arylformamidase